MNSVEKFCGVRAIRAKGQGAEVRYCGEGGVGWGRSWVGGDGVE